VLLLLACFSRHNKYFCGPNAYRTLKQAKQEKSKQKEATLKAMNTLKITKKGEELPEGAGGSGSLDKVRCSVQVYHSSAFFRIRIAHVFFLFILQIFSLVLLAGALLPCLVH
jgi:hypothetical protein